MNIYIRIDLEGVTGVVSYDQAEPGNPHYAFGRRMLTSDLNAAAEGCFEGGADRVAAYDMHCDGHNVLLDEVCDKLELICGKPRPEPEFIRQFDALMLVGFHGKAGSGTLLAHSYEGDTLDIRVNGISVGEIGMEAAIAGECGLPLILLVGDSAACVEVKALSPETRTVEVKRSLSARDAVCLPPEATRRLIRAAAADAVKHIGNVKPISFGPFERLEVDLPAPAPIRRERLAEASNAELRGNTVLIQAPSLHAAWHRYRWLRGAPDGG